MADSVSSDGPANRNAGSAVRTLVVHLRLHYQLLLAPIFLWGYFLAGGRPNLDFWLAFVAFHVFGYGGGTAFNSYYDRDEGPVGGLETPPPVIPALLPFSLAMQTVGAIFAAFVNRAFLAIYLLMFVLGVAYSHPSVRLKRRPLVGLATVGLGQGVLASLGGWVSTGATLSAIDPISFVGIVAVTLVTVGFYPLTHVYQIDEDRARGDVTFAVWAGPRTAFRFTVVVQAVATVLLAAVIHRMISSVQATVVAVFYGVVLLAVLRVARTFDDADVHENYRRIMYLNAVTSFGFLVFIALHLFDVL